MPWGVLLKCYQQSLWSRVALCFLSFYLFIFLWFCFGRKSKRLEWWSSMNQMHHPLLCSLPLEIIPVYFGNGSQKLCCHSYLGSDGLRLNYMQISWCLWIKNGERGEGHYFSVCFLSSYSSFSLSLCLPCLPLCFCLVWCPHCFNVKARKARAHSHCVPDISLWAL